MEKRQTRRQTTQSWGRLFATTRVGDRTLKLHVLDISIGGMGVLVTDGFSLLREGAEIFIETLEKEETVMAAEIHGRIAYLGQGVPTRAGIDFAPAETPIEAYARLHGTRGDTGKLITDQEEILRIFTEIKNWSRGFGDMLMVFRHRAIPAEFFYLRPQIDNMVLRIVRMSEFRLPFEPKPGCVYPLYLFKGVNVMLFHVEVTGVIKNILETTWPETLQHVSRRSVLRYFVTGQEPMTATIVHPISSEKIEVMVWDISIEGMGVEALEEKTPIFEGMNLPEISIHLPAGTIVTSGVVRSVRKEQVLDKTQLGIEFIGGSEHYRDRILGYILEKDLPPETIVP